MKKNKFAERLKFLRITAGMSQSELAKALEVARQTISLYENGERECSFDMLMNIADFFGTTVCFLIDRTDQYNYPVRSAKSVEHSGGNAAHSRLEYYI